MTQLEEDKLKEEIRGLKIGRYINVGKGIAIFIGSIILFAAIRMPESILNKKMSAESISKDRAKLVFELIHNNKDFENVLLELSVIEKAYPNEDSIWLNEIKNIYKTKIEKNNNSQILKAIDSSNRVTFIRKELQELYAKKEDYQVKYFAEISGKGQTGIAGQGSLAKVLRYEIVQLEQEIQKKQQELDTYNK